MRSEEGQRTDADLTEWEDEELEEEHLFWEVAAHVAAQRPLREEHEDSCRRRERFVGHVTNMALQAGEPTFVPMPRASRGFQSPVLLSPRIAHRVIDLTRGSSARASPQESSRRDCSRLRKSNSAESKSIPRVGTPFPGCALLGRRRSQFDAAAHARHVPVGGIPPRPLARTAPALGAAAPPNARPLCAAAHSSPLVPPNAVCAPMALGVHAPRRPASPLASTLRPVGRGSAGLGERGIAAAWRPVAPAQPSGLSLSFVPPERRPWGEPPSGLSASSTQVAPLTQVAPTAQVAPLAHVARASRSTAAVRIPEEDTLAGSGNVSTIPPADEQPDESFAASEVAVSMIINTQEAEQAAPEGEPDPATASDASSLHHDGLANDTQLIYPQPSDRLACADVPTPREGCGQQLRVALANAAAGTGHAKTGASGQASSQVPLYLRCEAPAQMSVGTTASSSTTTGRSESEATAEGSTASLETWCRTMGLSEAVLQRLRDERFQCPEHLVHLDREDMKELTEGLRLGDKCSFFNAVTLLKESIGSRASIPNEC